MRKIRDIMVGFPGSVHDSRVFRASPLFNTLAEKCHGNYILGDSGFPCLQNSLTPYKDFGQLTRRQQNYNLKLSKTRYVVEHTIGLLKQKFRQLYHLKLRGDHDIANFIRACCVLHNMALDGDAMVLEEHENVNADVPNLADLRDDRGGLEMRNHVVSILPLN